MQGSTVFDLQAATDLQTHLDMKHNEQALKTSKDISVANTMSKKQIFDIINAEDEELTPQGPVLDRLLIHDDK